MRLDITARHIELTPPLRQLITKRLARLDRVLNDAAVSALVIVTKEKYRHRTEIAVHTRGDHVLRGDGELNTWPLSIRDAVERIEQQATKLKGKWDERKRKSLRPPAWCTRRLASRRPRAASSGRPATPSSPCQPRMPRSASRTARKRSSSSGTPRLTPSASCTAARTAISGSSSRSRVGDTAPRPGVSVATVLRDLADSRALDLEVLAGRAGIERRNTIPHTQKTGLALSGFDAYLRSGRVLVFGESEVRYLESLQPAERNATMQRVFSHDLPCLLVTGGLTTPPEVAIEADRARVPLLATRAATAEVMARLSAVLDTYLAARGVVHGVLMDILGLGVLIVGESGIGKSECALDLVVRGHRLVADDAVELRCRAQSFVIGTCPAHTPSHGDSRSRADQRAGHVRRRLDALVQARGAGRAAGAVGTRTRV